FESLSSVRGVLDPFLYLLYVYFWVYNSKTKSKTNTNVIDMTNSLMGPKTQNEAYNFKLFFITRHMFLGFRGKVTAKKSPNLLLFFIHPLRDFNRVILFDMKVVLETL
ncbi:unnamed protein product, partial [Meganyctiphanes norvegica]